MKKVKTTNTKGTITLYSQAEMMLRLKTKPTLAQFFFPAYNEEIQAKPIGFIFNPNRGSIWYEETEKGVFDWQIVG